MVKRFLKYPRYNPSRLRPKGAGAFFDFVLGVANRDVRKLKSCSLMRRWGNKGVSEAPLMIAEGEPTEA
jgi:hypothetical protein